MNFREPINITSTSYKKGGIGGPMKVIMNTLKGMDKIGQPYVVNQPISQYRYNWVHDNPIAFIDLTGERIPFLAGPNIFALPRDFPRWFNGSPESFYLHPSDWTIEFWGYLGYKGCRLKKWAAGIDSDKFVPVKKNNTVRVLVYFKKREPVLLESAIRIATGLGLVTSIIQYGFYNEDIYRKALSECRFGIWIGTTESQGIALLEALSTGLPLIILNSTNILDNTASEITDMPSKIADFKATTIPYFDERCGIIITDLNQLEEAILTIQENFVRYSPRQYILDNFTLEKCASNLIKLFQELNFENFRGTEGSLVSEMKTDFSKVLFKSRRLVKIARRKTLNALKKSRVDEDFSRFTSGR